MQKSLRMVIYRNRKTFLEQDNMNAYDLEVQNLIGNLDQAVILYEAKWGADRIPKLCSAEIGEKWDRHFAKLCAAIDANDLQMLRQLVPGAHRAYEVMEASALSAGHKPHDAEYWEVQLPEIGMTGRIVRNDADAWRVAGEGIAVWTLSEVARMMQANALVNKVKDIFPGAKIEKAGTAFDFKQGDSVEF